MSALPALIAHLARHGGTCFLSIAAIKTLTARVSLLYTCLAWWPSGFDFTLSAGSSLKETRIMRRINLKKAQAARLNTIRDINRQIVLNYVREREPISRADISRETALQRSTISTIVEALKSEGLVEEIGEGESASWQNRSRSDGAV